MILQALELRTTTDERLDLLMTEDTNDLQGSFGAAQDMGNETLTGHDTHLVSKIEEDIDLNTHDLFDNTMTMHANDISNGHGIGKPCSDTETDVSGGKEMSRQELEYLADKVCGGIDSDSGGSIALLAAQEVRRARRCRALSDFFQIYLSTHLG